MRQDEFRVAAVPDPMGQHVDVYLYTINMANGNTSMMTKAAEGTLEFTTIAECEKFPHPSMRVPTALWEAMQHYFDPKPPVTDSEETEALRESLNYERHRVDRAIDYAFGTRAEKPPVGTGHMWVEDVDDD